MRYDVKFKNASQPFFSCHVLEKLLKLKCGFPLAEE